MKSAMLMNPQDKNSTHQMEARQGPIKSRRGKNLADSHYKTISFTLINSICMLIVCCVP
jgi:hypothetical protein